ncbi:MAG: hypothetical protein FWD24_00230 [Treponema sp.]|nr:hypothetical protein [Treponema sp.]
MKIQKIVFIFITALCIFILSACFSPWVGDEGQITFNFGDSARSFVNWDREKNNLSYEITLKSPGMSDIVRTFPSTGGSITVLPGTYSVTIKARDNNTLKGYGLTSGIDVKAGFHTAVSLEIHSAVEVGNFDQLNNALELMDENGISFNNPDIRDSRKLYIFITNDIDGFNNGEPSLLVVLGNKILISEKNVTIKGTRIIIDGFDFPTTFSLGMPGMEGTIIIRGIEEGFGAPLVSLFDAEFYMYDGVTLTNHYNNDNFGILEGVVRVSGQFFMYGGTIEKNKSLVGGGVSVGMDGIFEMHGGTISSNIAGESGGGICVNSNGTFIMYGGVVYGTDDPGLANISVDDGDSLINYGVAIYGNGLPILPATLNFSNNTIRGRR